MPQEILSKRDELVRPALDEEALDVLVEPRLVPAGDVVDPRLFFGVSHVGKVADHHDGFLLAEYGRLHEIWRLFKHLITIIRLRLLFYFERL